MARKVPSRLKGDVKEARSRGEFFKQFPSAPAPALQRMKAALRESKTPQFRDTKGAELGRALRSKPSTRLLKTSDFKRPSSTNKTRGKK